MFTGLKQNTPYAAVLYTTRAFESWRRNTAISKLCFCTAADLDRPLARYDNIGHPGEQLRLRRCAQSSPCVPVQGQNASGTWVRTDSEDGFE